MLLAGELLQVLGQGQYQAAVHRVVRPAGLSEPRVSTPLLVRGAAGVAVRDSMLPATVTAKFDEKEEAEDTREKVEPGKGDGGRLTMTDVWAALQFRGGAVEPGTGVLERAGGFGENSPLARRVDGGEDEVRDMFRSFAKRGRVTVLSVEPLLVRLHGFASRTECAAIVSQALEGLAESTTWGGADAQDESNTLRSSSTTWIADGSLPLLADMTARVCAMSGLPPTFMEKWQVRAVGGCGYFFVQQHGGVL